MVRIKHRYLLCNILYPEKPNAKLPQSTADEAVPAVIQFHRPTPDRLTPHILRRAIEDDVAYLFGDWGAGMIASGLKIVYLSTATSTAIIRISRQHYRLVWAALSFMTKLPKPIDTPCVIRVIRVSGTIKKVEEEAIARARKIIRQAKEEDERLKVVGKKFGEEGIAEVEEVGEDLGVPVTMERIDDDDDDDDLDDEDDEDDDMEDYADED